MIKLLIADDEPLVCVGLQSILNWEDFGIEIVGTARNGQQAFDMIGEFRPEIVLTDIKMPLKNGLELAEECHETYGDIPLFIFLTSFEEFKYLQKAISLQAVDYLIKLELSPEALSTSISKALRILEKHRKLTSSQAATWRGGNGQAMQERFFMRLFNDLFESDEQYEVQKQESGLDFSGSGFVAVSCEIRKASGTPSNSEHLIALCNSTVQMVKETARKTHRCYVVPLDARHFSIVLCLDAENEERYRQIEEVLERSVTIVHNYFSVDLRAAAGYVVKDPRRLGESWHSAQRLLHQTTDDAPLLIYRSSGASVEESFVFSEIRPSIRKAFSELNAPALYEAITRISDYFEEQPEQRVQAMDAACNVLFMAISLLPDGEDTVQGIFEEDTEGYRGIYRMTRTDQIVDWLRHLRDGCCEVLSAHRQSYKQQIVGSVQEYIRENLDKRLSLNEVAAVFNFSPNYLSQLFAKYAGEGFVEYTTGVRIEAAKEMLARGDGKIYEIAERLGFYSAFYFSKVFKKVEGVSPREYQQNLHKQTEQPKRKGDTDHEGDKAEDSES